MLISKSLSDSVGLPKFECCASIAERRQESGHLRIDKLGTEKLIWSALSETILIDQSVSNQEIKSFINVMVKNIKEDNLLK